MSIAPLATLLPDFADDAAASVTQMLDRSSAQARAAAETAEQEARHAAYEQGVRDGRDAAGAETARALTTIAAALERADGVVAATAAEQLRADARLVVECAEQLASWVLGRHLAVHPDGLLEQVAALVTDLPPGTAVTVSVHPEASAAYAAWAATDRERGVEVVADPSMAVGDAHVTTSSGGTARVGAAAALRRAVRALTHATGDAGA